MLNRVDFVPIMYANKIIKRVCKPLMVQGIENIGVSDF